MNFGSGGNSKAKAELAAKTAFTAGRVLLAAE